MMALFKKEWNRALFIGILVCISVLSFKGIANYYSEIAAEKIGTHLTNRITGDSTHIANGSLENLTNSPFLIKIYREGKLLYWNDQWSANYVKEKSVFNKNLRIANLNVEFSLPSNHLNGFDLSTIKGIVPLNSIDNKIVLSNDIEINPKRIRISGNYYDFSLINIPQVNIISLLILLIWFFGVGKICSSLLLVYKSKPNEIKYFISLLAVWLVITYVVHPLFFGQSIFEITEYTYAFGSKSLLDLIFDMLILIFLFLGIGSGKIKSNLYKIRPDIRLFLGASIVSAMFYWMITQIEGFILREGSVTININQILNLDSLKFIFLLSLIGYGFLSFYISTLFFKKGTKKISIARRTIFVEIGIILSTLIFIFTNPSTPAFPVLLFLMVFFLSLDLYSDIKINNVSFILWWLLLYSGFLAFNIYYTSYKKEFENRRENLENTFKLLDENERRDVKSFARDVRRSQLLKDIGGLPVGENLEYNDILVMVDEIFQKSKISDGYYIHGIDCFSNFNKSLFYNKKSDILTSRQAHISGVKLTDNINFLPYKPQLNLHFKIEDQHQIMGQINFEIRLARKEYDPKQSVQKFMIFKDGQVIGSEGDLDYIEVVQEVTTDTIIGNISFLRQEIGDGYEVIEFVDLSSLIKPITLFSLMFGLGGFSLILLSLLNTRFEFLPEDLALRFNNRSSLRTKIQMAVIVLVIFSFLVIGVITAFYFNNLSNDIKGINFDEEVAVISTQIQKEIQDTQNPDLIKNQLYKLCGDLNTTYDGRINYYNADGTINSVSSGGYGSVRLLPQNILRDVEDDNKNRENVGVSLLRLNDSEVLIPIYGEGLEVLGYFSVADDTRRYDKYNVYEYLSTLLNVYIFLFLLAGAISIVIANSITKPLIKLNASLKKFKLGKKNMSLKWDSNDEIGALIKDYNIMIEELSKSATIIAKTERDMAWREMAKQVAHEIKNPLTPMKLNIQYLEKALSADPSRAKEMISKISKTLIEQINNLSQIAGEFSNFASMPRTSNEKIILNEVVEHIHDLFRKRDDMEIEMIEPMNEIYIFADRNHLVRILNNIVKNAIQAIPSERRGKIEIELKQENDTAIIRVSDNGVGIPDDMKSKVFTPNFTTKSSGTGLGLAISANMIESMNGKIYFETKQGEGTDFYVNLPAMRSITARENEVLLDD